MRIVYCLIKKDDVNNIINKLISVLPKAFLCLLVILKLGRQTSLVTPGDAIESYISQPTDHVAGSCLLDQRFLWAKGNGIGHNLVPGLIYWSPKP